MLTRVMATNQQMAFIKIIYYFSILSNYINNNKKNHKINHCKCHQLILHIIL